MHIKRARRMGLPAWRATGFHSARKACRERIYREFQWPVARRMSERVQLRIDRACPALIEGWRRDYNDRRRHGALGHLTPSEYSTQRQTNVAEAANLQVAPV